MKAMVRSNYRKGLFTLLLFMCFFIPRISEAQVVGDYQSTGSTAWNLNSTWEIWNGTMWTAAGALPSSANTVYIRTGHTVTVPTAGGPFNSRSLMVEAGAKLYSNQSATNVYINIWGTSVICHGEIGNGAVFDGLSFNFEAANTSITGTGIITASRMRKSAATNATTNLTINTNVSLRWDQASNTQLYNNNTGATLTKFNVTIAAGVTLNCTGSATNPGNVSIDGVDGLGSFRAAGTITVNGTLEVAGRIFMRSNNPTAGDSTSWIINNGGLLRCASVYVGNSGPAGNFLRVMSGGKLEIKGSPGFEPSFAVGSTLPTGNNAYLFYPGSFCEYSGAGNQYVPSIPNTVIPSNPGPASNFGYYGNLRISTWGVKELAQASTTTYPFIVYDNFEIISSASGDPIFDCNSWTIDVGGSWYNYDESGFTEASGRVRFWRNGVATINCPGGEIFNLLTYNKSVLTPVTFNTKVTVVDEIEWVSNGAYVLNGYDLILKKSSPTAFDNGGSTTRYLYSERTDNSSRVVWNIGAKASTTSFVIPFGTSPTTPIPFTFTVNAGTNPDSVKVSTYGTPATNLPWPSTPNNVTNLNGVLNPVPDNRNFTVDRFWQVNSTAASPPAMSYIFTYRSAELPGSVSDPLTIGAQNWNPLSSGWRLPVIGTGTASYTVAVSNSSFYGPWTLVGYSSPLPVELLKFHATANGTVVDLDWSTASETDNLRFDVERSDNGRVFTRIGEVAGSGTTTVQQHYRFTDSQPLSGLSYYRLVQIDFDGTREVGPVAAVNFRKNLAGTLYPQPASDFVYWEPKDKDGSKELIFSIYSPSGSLVSSKTVSAEGSGRYELSTVGLANSLYFLTITGDGIQQQVPLLINKQ